MCNTDLTDQFRIVIIRYKSIDYNLNVMRHSAWLTQSCLVTLLTSFIAHRRTLWWPAIHLSGLVSVALSTKSVDDILFELDY